MDIDTGLCYRRKNINKAIQKIHEIAKKSNMFIIESDFRFDEIDSEDNRYVIMTNMLITPKKRLAKRLDKLFGENEEDEDIKYHWTRKTDESFTFTDKWPLYILGRELCNDIKETIHNESYDFNSCPCPKDFKEYCKKTNEILRKYSLTHL
ncbi:MAG: hypothetical protein MUC80_00490 [Candidatus Thermoplasmatota archaeon]|nr:hypothetical protein [Candidatus Thermoplasmatota archaeon]